MHQSFKLNTALSIGGSYPTRVNCNIGCNSKKEYQIELAKLRFLKENGDLPDMMMDLSLVDVERPLYLTIRDELKLPFGTVLSYHGFNKLEGLSWEKTKAELLKLCEENISFVTIHFTADWDVFQKAKLLRKIPMTSRGGGIVLYDSLCNHLAHNIFRKHIDEIAEIALKYDVAISLGTTFRPATIFDACDEVHIEETNRQLSICQYLQNQGVKVIVENIGHIALDKLYQHVNLLKSFHAPIMPLGPMPTDYAVNQDHISNAIGSSVAAYLGVAHIINSVTRYEHSQSSISAEVTLEAIKAAKVAAHIADVSRQIPEALNKDKYLTDKKACLQKCFANSMNCDRCSSVCPLKILSDD